ncbi:coiled-coil domain-containing protein AGAP005037 isoform X7 [Neocloeon triangulifer]|uniref:coiled-coil domain-containing protein AGAP005037 isoform X7 n=1 Tax=Neocloeon triangulifer TaxID=2078957 RepID=UPI00286ED556|nr:coiled-coil domain-containing protein AGAP005037 isoform X7 [Neocloeon triangulifer]
MADGCDSDPDKKSTSASAESKRGEAPLCKSEANIVLHVPRSPEEHLSDAPVPAPRTKLNNKVPTLLVLFPPEGIKKGHSREEEKASEKSVDRKNIFIEPTVEELKLGKDLASLAHPTAPRVPAPLGSIKSPPPTVRGPKGVNHPQLSELLKSCKAKYKVVFQKKQPSPPRITQEEEDKNDANRSESGSSSSRSSSDNPDAYADLVQELARHEKAVRQLREMPVHETAFLTANSPQPAPTKGYDTTDDELDGILRNKQRHEHSVNLRQQNVIRVIKPAPLNNVVIRNNLTSPTNRYEMERYQHLLREQNYRLQLQEQIQNGLTNGHLVRNGPFRNSVGTSASLNRTFPQPQQQSPSLQQQMMRRSYSLNAEQVKAARKMNGTPTSPKRVSFSTLPSSNVQNKVNGNGTPVPRQSRRPVSSDSVFFHKPLPPVPEARTWLLGGGRRTAPKAPESESGSEAGEIQRILFANHPRRGPSYVSFRDDEWSDGKPRLPGDPNAPAGSKDEDLRRGGSRGRRDDPRRHTLAGDQQGGPASAALTRSMDLEMGTKSRGSKKSSSSLQRNYYHQQVPLSSSMFDDDPGIMSEVETASTGFRRGGKQRSSLPVVRTPSKTLERPLGLVFLQYRNETKRALLPNEITSIDTVKALFVRSFPKQLTMEYLDSPMVKIYIHDSSKDMFYELEDLRYPPSHRSHLRDIRDRSVLRLFESPDINGGAMPVGSTPLPGGLPAHSSPSNWDQDQSYFSEPEFDSEYQHQHIHKSKGSKGSSSAYYLQHSFPPGQQGAGGSATLPRGAPPVIRAYSPATKPVSQAVFSTPLRQQRIYQEIGPRDPMRSPPNLRSPTSPVQRPQSTPPRPPERWAYSRSRDLYSDLMQSESGYMSSPERGRQPYSNYPAAGAYEDPYYAQYGARSGSITPVIDEEASDSDELLMEAYGIYGNTKGGSTTVAAAAARIQQPSPRPPSFPSAANMINSQTGAALMPYDATRLRVENMERQLANLTGLVQKALTQGPQPSPTYLQIPNQSPYRNDDYDKHSSSSSASLPDESYLRAETTTPTTKPPKLGKDKSVSFEKSVSFSDDPPDMLSSPKQHTPQHSDRDRHKPAPPPKPMALATHTGQYDAGRHLYRADLQLTPEMYNHLRVLQKKAKDLRQEVRNLRRMSQAQAHSVRETIRDTFIKIRALLLTGGGDSWLASGDTEKLKISREEELYKQEMIRLEKDLTELESTVEELRGNVINKKTRVNMSDVENMALVLSKSSKTVADLKVRFPNLQDGMKSLLSSEMEKVVREEKFLKEEPERLESALRRCKKLTGTLVTLKRLASVQEQRLPIGGVNNVPDPQMARLSPDNLLEDQPPQSGAISPQSKSSGDGCSTPCSSASATIPARGVLAPAGGPGEATKRQENALDTLLDELQTFARPPSTEPVVPPAASGGGTLRRLHSYPSGSDSSSPVRSSRVDDKPPSLPERSKVPPPPPPRTSSKSPLVSPTSPPRLQPRGQNLPPAGGTLRRKKAADPPPEDGQPAPAASNSSSSESINSQEGLKNSEALEQRHQELLRRQKQLQEQYARLQQLQRNVRLPTAPELKKTGSESNLLRGLNLSAAPTSGSLTHLAPASMAPINIVPPPPPASDRPAAPAPTANKVYETDIL